MSGPDATSRPGPPVALYVHIPFCLSVCPYCDFVVYAGAAARGPASRIEAFLAALQTEIELRASALDDAFGPRRDPLGSVYFGGGTPSLLSSRAVASLLDLVACRYGLAAGAEITLEANPGPADRGDLAGFVSAGVNRISFGAQSLDPAQLRRLGRRHRPDDVSAAMGEARRAGVRSVNLDLLYDLPGASVASWLDSLERALALGPDHLSLYALSLDDPTAEGLTGPGGDHLPPSAGARRWRERARAHQDDDRAADDYCVASERLAAAGFRAYEISNWARPGHESRHNLVYWRRRPYEAVGPGAHAFDGTVRRWNAASLEAYLHALQPDAAARVSLPPGGSEVIDPAVAASEAIILSLRTDRGVSLAEACQSPLGPHMGWALEHGLLAPTAGDRVALTTTGRLLSNELFARLV